MKIPILAVAAVAALLAFSAPAYAASDQSYESIIGLGAQAPLTLLDNQTLGAGHIDVAAGMDVDIDLTDRGAAPAYTEFISVSANARTGDIFFQRDLQTYGFADGHLAGSDLGLTTNRGADDFTEQI